MIRFLLKWGLILFVILIVWTALTQKAQQIYWWMYP